MDLVVSTQARFSTFLIGHEHRDDEVRLNLESLGKAVRWRMTTGLPITTGLEGTLSNRTSLQRGPSIARQRRRDWRASSEQGPGWTTTLPDKFTSQGHLSDGHQAGRDEDGEDDDITPGQSVYYTGQRSRYSTIASTVASTFNDGTSTIREGDPVYDAKTPQAETYRRAKETETDLTPIGQPERR